MRPRRVAARPFALTLVALPLLAQQLTFRTGVDIVKVDVSIAQGGEHVSGLTAENFEVLDNGVRQKIASVTFERVPLEVYLVLDLSGSVAGLKLHELKRAAYACVDRLVAPDKVALLTFSNTVIVRQELTSNTQALKAVLWKAESGGKTALYDGVAKAVSLRTPNDRRAIVVVFTDGQDSGSGASPNQVSVAAERSDVTVYGVMAPDVQGTAAGAGPVGFHSGAQYQSGFLGWLTRATGGREFLSGTGRSLEDLFQMVLDDARSRYVLTYTPDKTTPGWHRLNVTLVGASGDVVARRGYFVGTSAGGK